jgi:hypothetical protein
MSHSKSVYVSSNNNYDNLINFMNSRRKGSVKNFEATHLGMEPYRGSFDFSGIYNVKFLELYSKVVQEGKQLSLVEKPNKNGITYLLLDVDFNQKKSRRQYTTNDIENIIKNINRILMKTFDISRSSLEVYVTEKPTPTKKNEHYKDGFHIYYPNIPFNIEQRFYIIDLISQINKKKSLFKNVKYTNDSDTIFDTNVIKKNGIMMIGSAKPNCEPYKLTHIYDYHLIEKDIEDYDINELIFELNNQKFDEYSETKLIDPQMQKEIDTVYKSYNGGIKKRTMIKEKKNY